MDVSAWLCTIILLHIAFIFRLYRLLIMVYRLHAVPLLAVYRFHYSTPLVTLQGTCAFVFIFWCLWCWWFSWCFRSCSWCFWWLLVLWRLGWQLLYICCTMNTNTPLQWQVDDKVWEHFQSHVRYTCGFLICFERWGVHSFSVAQRRSVGTFPFMIVGYTVQSC